MDATLYWYTATPWSHTLARQAVLHTGYSTRKFLCVINNTQKNHCSLVVTIRSSKRNPYIIDITKLFSNSFSKVIISLKIVRGISCVQRHVELSSCEQALVPPSTLIVYKYIQHITVWYNFVLWMITTSATTRSSSSSTTMRTIINVNNNETTINQDVVSERGSVRAALRRLVAAEGLHNGESHSSSTASKHSIDMWP